MMTVERKLAIAEAAVRLAHEPLRNLRDLTDHAKVSYQALVRYATQSRNGVYLDAIKDNGEWYSSVEAVRRFLVAWAARNTSSAVSSAASSA